MTTTRSLDEAKQAQQPTYNGVVVWDFDGPLNHEPGVIKANIRDPEMILLVIKVLEKHGIHSVLGSQRTIISDDELVIDPEDTEEGLKRKPLRKAMFDTMDAVFGPDRSFLRKDDADEIRYEVLNQIKRGIKDSLVKREINTSYYENANDESKLTQIAYDTARKVTNQDKSIILDAVNKCFMVKKKNICLIDDFIEYKKKLDTANNHNENAQNNYLFVHAPRDKKEGTAKDRIHLAELLRRMIGDTDTIFHDIDECARQCDTQGKYNKDAMEIAAKNLKQCMKSYRNEKLNIMKEPRLSDYCSVYQTQIKQPSFLKKHKKTIILALIVIIVASIFTCGVAGAIGGMGFVAGGSIASFFTAGGAAFPAIIGVSVKPAIALGIGIGIAILTAGATLARLAYGAYQGSKRGFLNNTHQDDIQKYNREITSDGIKPNGGSTLTMAQRIRIKLQSQTNSKQENQPPKRDGNNSDQLTYHAAPTSTVTTVPNALHPHSTTS